MIPQDYVAMERQTCPVCLKLSDTGSILIHKRLRSIENPVTGWGMCPEHQAQVDDGYILLVECDGVITTRPEDLKRTGTVVSVKSTAYEKIFRNGPPACKFAIIDREVTARLEEITNEVCEMRMGV